MTSMVSPASIAPGPAAEAAARLTVEQAALWRFQQRRPLSAAYNVCAAVVIEGDVDRDRLAQTATAVIARHPAVASTVVEDGEQHLRWAAAPGAPHWQDRPDRAGGADIAAWARGDGAAPLVAEARRPFLPGEPLHRLVFWNLGAAGGLLQLTFHHCACDGLSLRLLVEQIIAGYADGADARPQRPSTPLPYQPLVNGDEAEEFWAPRLALAQRTGLLAPARNEDFAADDAGVQLCRVLAISVDDCHRRAAQCHGSAFAVVLAGIASGLARWSGQEDFALRVPFSHREPAADDRVDYRVRALPLQVAVSGSDTIGQAIARIGTELRSGIIHADWAVPGAVDIVGAEAGGSAPIVVNQLQPPGLLTHHLPAAQAAGGCRWQPYLIPNGTAKTDLTVFAAEHDGRVTLTLEFRRAAVDAAEREQLADLLAECVTHAVAADLDQSPIPPGEPPRPTRAAPVAKHQASVAIEAAFLDAAERHPEALAVIDDGLDGAGAASYGQLAAASKAIAEDLVRLGAGPGRAVAVQLPRSAALIAAVYAVVRAWGVLLIVDPDTPPARAAHMLADSRAHLIIEPATDVSEAVTVAGQRLRVRVLTPEAQQIPLADPQLAEQAAYVMYTSGSTGRPKGAAISRAGILNRLIWMQRAYPLGPGNVVLAKTALSFDVCLWELLWPVMTGATVVAARPGRHGDADYLSDAVERFGVDTLHFVPAMLAAFLDAAQGRRLPSLRTVFTSGERLSLSLARRAVDLLGADLHNLYGPTEAAIDVTAWTFRHDDRRPFVPIGVPIDNMTIRLCDPTGAEVPPGAPGELVIEGVGVGLGYLGDGTLDVGRFATDPASGQRSYRTGDLARRRAGGVLEFLGRRDDQVKINGQRVELEEIDAVLAAHPGVAAAAVWHRGDAPGPQLQACLVLRDGAELSVAELRAHAGTFLPESLIPSVFRVVDALAYSASGKLDRAALPTRPGRELAAAQLTARVAGPAGAGEAALGQALAELLGGRTLAPDVDLFHQGLDSMMALRLVTAMRGMGWALESADVFETRTLRALAGRLYRREEPGTGQLQAAARTAPPQRWRGAAVERRFPLSALQLGLVYHRDVSADYLTYLSSYDLDGEVDAAVLRRSLAQAARHHEFLRSGFDLAVESGPEQVVLTEVAVDLVEHDLAELGEQEQAEVLDRWRRQVRTEPFDWDRPPLFAFHLHRLGAGRAVFSIIEPFLDGWSVAVLAREIFDIYEQTVAEGKS